MANSFKQKGHKAAGQQNVLEALRDIVTQSATTLKDEAIKSADIVDNILNIPSNEGKNKYSGDLRAGESVSLKDIFSNKNPEKPENKSGIFFERQLINEERGVIEQKTNDLRLQLHAVMQEAKAIIQATQNISQELKVASMQAPVEPGVYHLVFFEKLLETLRSFKKKIDNACVWLAGVNKRAKKMNYWSRYKESKSSFLLSPEHYMQRNAG